MAELPPGTEVAGCRIDSLLGRGGMGVVYRATQLSLDRVVALKAIVPELAMDAEFRERFQHEARLAASIEHPNVIPVYEAGDRDGLLYLIMRYVEGTDLRALLDREDALEPARAARLVAQVAAALGAAHRRGLVHRDVKPANVLLGANGHAYLTDFGIARNLAATRGLTRTGAVVGTLDYIAPERLEQPKGDARSDIYALGCVLFETLTGSVPYPRDSEPAKMFAHASSPVPSARELRGDVPEALDDLAHRSMAKDPAERPATADELAEELLAFASAPSVGAGETASPAAARVPAGPTRAAPTEDLHGPAAPRARVTEPAVAEAAATRPAQRAPAGRRGQPSRGALLGGLAAALAIVVIAVLALSGGGSEKGDGDGATPAPRPLSPVALAPVAVGSGADGVAVGEGFAWVADKDDNLVTRVDSQTRRKAGTTPVGSEPDSIAIGAGSVWVTNSSSDDLSRIDPRTAKVVEQIPVGRGPEGIAVAEGVVWVANNGAGTVTRIDTGGGGRKTATVGRGPVQLAIAPDAVWVTASTDGTVVPLDFKTGERAGDPVQVGGEPRGIAFADDLLWVSSTKANQIVVIDPSSRKVVDRIDVAANPREVRAGEGGVWATNADASEVTAIDTRTRKVAGTATVKGKPFGLGVGEGLVWAAGLDNGLLTPIEPRGG